MTAANFDFTFSSTGVTRQNMINLMSDFSLEQLNKIPAGFNNNLVWNFGHVIVTQQLLCYGLSGLPIELDKDMIATYRKGGAPAGAVDQATMDMFIELSSSLLYQFKADYQAGLFKEYNTYTTSFNLTLNSVEEAFQFNLAHEAMHLGTMIALRKLV
jgi:hypothetical protein